jgi:MinD-like ATPase involved in chromosome partitioning or flagellar assembly
VYTITFYSFKGGVGRTLALVNVGAELAKMGRKVLLVDFDLEAPGLETYDRLRPPKPHPGIVEYVTEYERTMQAPDVREYIYPAPVVGKKGGRLWVMPAGRRDANYQAALVNIDWKRLYGERDGFLLFEDMKAQWEQEPELNPDYVLIDSRTGHTDVEGICTRQLADSVVLMFMPNEQNLIGLEGVCRSIRSEATEGLQKTIRLHFVASNVPDLDDESRILDRQMRAFRKRLDFKNLSGLVRRYESLSLLNQSIFTLDRPRTRLAHSYQRLVQTLLKDNFADREGAISFLEDFAKLNPASRPQDRRFTHQEFIARFPDQIPTDAAAAAFCAATSSVFHEYDEPFNEIRKRFYDDIEVLTKLADYCVLKENYDNALVVLDRVLYLRPDLPATYLRRASCNIQLAKTKEAADDLMTCLRQANQDGILIKRCLYKLGEIAPHRVSEAVDVLSTQGIPGELVEILCDSNRRQPLRGDSELSRPEAAD